MESLKCHSLVGGGNALAVTSLLTTQFQIGQYRFDNGNLDNCGARYPHGTVFALRSFILKGSYGYGELKNVIALSVQ